MSICIFSLGKQVSNRWVIAQRLHTVNQYRYSEILQNIQNGIVKLSIVEYLNISSTMTTIGIGLEYATKQNKTKIKWDISTAIYPILCIKATFNY
nr:MAG TPA: hypothetical protein [Caudoviricetes sp.]